MRYGGFRSVPFAICAVLGAASAASAQDRPPGAGISRWTVNGGEYRCTLSRRFGDGMPVSLSIRIVPGDETADIIIVNPAWARGVNLPSQVRIVLGPSGRGFEGAAQNAPVPSAQHRFMRILQIDRDFFDSLVNADRLAIEGDGRELLSISLTQAAPATRALRACHDELLRGWGIDTVAAASVTRRPVPLGQTALYLGSVDPIAGPEASQSSFLVMRYTVGVNGRITNCEVVREVGRTGHGPIICSRARQDARFEPALGPDNRPVPFQLIQTTALVRR